jgi:hypothetical protein
MEFNTADAPLLAEYLGHMGGPKPEAIDPVGPEDALLIIDMQNDFLVKDPTTNPNGG